MIFIFLTASQAWTLPKEMIKGERDSFYIERHLRFWGMDFDFCRILEYGISEKTDTILCLSAGGAVRELGYYRDKDDLYFDESSADYLYTRLNTNWGAGIEQGLLWNSEGEKNLLSLRLKYRGLRELNFNLAQQDALIFDSLRPDRDGILLNTFIAALVLDNTFFNFESGLKKGYSAELALEAGPKWFLNDVEGDSDFIKYFAGAKAFIPFYEAAEPRDFLQAIYIADYAGIDSSKGDLIPLTARQTYGILRQKNGAGGMVRGFESRRFDSELKVINNIELRLIMRQIKNEAGKKLLRPGMLAFFDYAMFALLDGYDKAEGSSGDGGWLDDSGKIASAGIGLFSEVLSVGTVMMYAGFPLAGSRIDSKAMSVTLTYGLHF
ncbi:MAG: hypothetical protein RBT69_09725 [Spirochaetia bacterium]|nr:hypothetical protein [Spirochaetia bacterium]